MGQPVRRKKVEIESLTYFVIAIERVKETLGPFSRYLTEGQKVQEELLEGSPIHVMYPQTVVLRVVTTPEAVHTQHDSNVFKSAILENDMEVLVPHFVKPGEMVRIEVETGKYLERV